MMAQVKPALPMEMCKVAPGTKAAGANRRGIGGGESPSLGGDLLQEPHLLQQLFFSIPRASSGLHF